VGVEQGGQSSSSHPKRNVNNNKKEINLVIDKQALLFDLK
jgi:hypothetical protein